MLNDNELKEQKYLFTHSYSFILLFIFIYSFRWKAHFFLNKQTSTTANDYFGLPSKAFAPPIAQMKAFEGDLLKLTSNIAFRKVEDQFLNQINNDIKTIRASKNVHVFADKSTNVYATSVDNYKKLLHENATKTYKIAEENITDGLNEELQTIKNKLGISNKIDIMAQRNSYITLKDHKESFQTNPKFRLINPTKTELGKVSKAVLDDVNTRIRNSINVNQWKNSYSVTEWFNSLENKLNCRFLSFDIIEFYPSITQELLETVLQWASTITTITDKKEAIIHHARKSLLFHGSTPWVKKNNDSMFDVTMGSFDGAEICDLVGLFLLNQLAKKFGNKFVGLYRDDGLVILQGKSARIADNVGKEMHEIFKVYGLRITADINHQSVNFLDITLNLSDGTYAPHTKPNNVPLYINRNSNHPPAIIKQIPRSINKRISSLSANHPMFESTTPVYRDALRRSSYKEPFTYQPPNVDPNQASASPKTNSTRRRNIIWFNPPFSKSVKTNVGKTFLKLIDKHFPPSNSLHKIFNRNNVNVSYSCMEKIKSAISNHNHKLLSNDPPASAQCNCKSVKECPLDGKCLSKNIVYKAQIKSQNNGTVKTYIGMTSNAFKERYRNHIKSFKHPQHSSETELSKHVWDLKNNCKDFEIKWSIVKRAPAYTPGKSRCSLCTEEKLQIIKSKSENLLNKRSELFSRCCHRNRFSVWNFKRKKITSASKTRFK